MPKIFFQFRFMIKKKKFIPIKLDINCKWILLSLLHSLLTLKCKFGASAIVDLFCLFFPIFISLSFVSLFSISWFISLKKKIITWTRRSKIRLNPIDRKAMEGRRGSKNSRKILRKKKKKIFRETFRGRINASRCIVIVFF